MRKVTCSRVLYSYTILYSIGKVTCIIHRHSTGCGLRGATRARGQGDCRGSLAVVLCRSQDAGGVAALRSHRRTCPLPACPTRRMSVGRPSAVRPHSTQARGGHTPRPTAHANGNAFSHSRTAMTLAGPVLATATAVALRVALLHASRSPAVAPPLLRVRVWFWRSRRECRRCAYGPSTRIVSGRRRAPDPRCPPCDHVTR